MFWPKLDNGRRGCCEAVAPPGLGRGPCGGRPLKFRIELTGWRPGRGTGGPGGFKEPGGANSARDDAMVAPPLKPPPPAAAAPPPPGTLPVRLGRWLAPPPKEFPRGRSVDKGAFKLRLRFMDDKEPGAGAATVPDGRAFSWSACALSVGILAAAERVTAKEKRPLQDREAAVLSGRHTDSCTAHSDEVGQLRARAYLVAAEVVPSPPMSWAHAYHCGPQ